MSYFLVSTEFLQGMWQGVFELLALAIVGYFVHVLYAKRSNRLRKRQEIIDELDEFVMSLWKPRRIYTLIQEKKLVFLNQIESAQVRETKTFELHQEAFSNFLDSIGRFRAVQIKLIYFYGFNIELLAHFTAIWMYLREVRHRMENNETLYFGGPRKTDGKKRIGSDDLYVLIDHFRLLISKAQETEKKPLQMEPSKEISDKIKNKAESLYQTYFGGSSETNLSKEAFQGDVLSYNVKQATTPQPS